MPGNGNPSLRDFDAYADRNGEISAGDVEPALTPTRRDVEQAQSSIASEASEQFRKGSRRTGDDATDVTAAESAPGVVEHLSDATLPGPAEAAIDRATSSLGEDDEDK